MQVIKTLKLARENIERVEWTLQDEEWRPSRDYLRKLLAAYRELAEAAQALLGDAPAS